VGGGDRRAWEDADAAVESELVAGSIGVRAVAGREGDTGSRWPQRCGGASWLRQGCGDRFRDGRGLGLPLCGCGLGRGGRRGTSVLIWGGHVRRKRAERGDRSAPG
jgi:hypothetical protein